ncbi:hypothetical protein VPH35_049819 [Triticum aestivum]
MPRADPSLPCIAPPPLAQGSPSPVPGPTLSRWLGPSTSNLASCMPCSGGASATSITDEHRGLEVQRVLTEAPAGERPAAPAIQSLSTPVGRAGRCLGWESEVVMRGADGRSCDAGSTGAATPRWGK